MQFYAFRKSVWHQLLRALLPFVAAMILITFLPQQWQTSFLSRILAILSFAAWIVYVIRFFTVGWKIQSWDCPRCGEPFFNGKGVRNPLARHCLHCGLYRPKRSELATSSPSLP